jgi:hypothetical protein
VPLPFHPCVRLTSAPSPHTVGDFRSDVNELATLPEAVALAKEIRVLKDVSSHPCPDIRGYGGCRVLTRCVIYNYRRWSRFGLMRRCAR